MKKEQLLKEIEELISELTNLLQAIQEYENDNSKENLDKGNKSFEIIKQKYFKYIKIYLGRKYFGDMRRQRFNNLLKWTGIEVGIHDSYLKDIIELLKQFKYELEGMNDKEYLVFMKIDNKSNYWRDFNPIYWLYLLLKLGLKHKIISGILIFIIITIFAAIVTDSTKPLTEKFSKPVSDYLSGSLNNYN